jgi:hypothetical protein
MLVPGGSIENFLIMFDKNIHEYFRNPSPIATVLARGCKT